MGPAPLIRLPEGVKSVPATAARLAGNAESEPGQWLSGGRTLDEQRYSPLAQINADNVGQLGLARYADYDSNRGQEATRSQSMVCCMCRPHGAG